MKIIALQASNIKKLVAVEIRPNGNMVEISGKNGAGKTSILDSLWWAIAGASAIQSQPIRKGASEARIRLDLGEIVVTRTFKRREGTEWTTAVSVENADGARFPSPQRMLDDLLGALTFDPLAFARSDAKAQFNTLRRFVPDIDFDKLAAEHKGDFDRRTEANRRHKEANAAASLVVVPDAPGERADDTSLLDQIGKAADHNSAIEKRKANREQAVAEVARLRKSAADILAEIPGRQASSDATTAKRVADIERQIEALQKQIAGLQDSLAAERLEGQKIHASIAEEDGASAAKLTSDADALQKRLDEAGALPEPMDVAALRKDYDEARRVNAAIDAATQAAAKHEAHAKTAADAKTESENLTARMAAREKAKRDAIAAAKLPVDGLGFGEGIVTLNGLPFDQASDAEQLRASIAIAMAGNPKLRVIRVRDGSLLDEGAMKLLAEMADENDMQVWIERVTGGEKVGFVIEDGRIKGDAEQQEAA